MNGWALDLGTTNSGLARWDDSTGRPLLLELPAISRKTAAIDALEAPRLVPSAVDFVERPGFFDQLGGWPPLARHFFIGRSAFVGREALERNDGNVRPSFVPAFKPALSSESLRPLARVGRRSVSACDAAQAFLREVLREAKRATGHRVRDLVVTSPVTAFETEVLEPAGLSASGVDDVLLVGGSTLLPGFFPYFGQRRKLERIAELQ